MCLSKLTHVAKQERGVKVALDISLLERLNLARKDVFDIERDTILLIYGSTNEVEGKKRGFGARAHSRDA